MKFRNVMVVGLLALLCASSVSAWQGFWGCADLFWLDYDASAQECTITSIWNKPGEGNQHRQVVFSGIDLPACQMTRNTLVTRTRDNTSLRQPDGMCHVNYVCTPTDMCNTSDLLCADPMACMTSGQTYTPECPQSFAPPGPDFTFASRTERAAAWAQLEAKLSVLPWSDATRAATIDYMASQGDRWVYFVLEAYPSQPDEETWWNRLAVTAVDALSKSSPGAWTSLPPAHLTARQ